jgi:mono/diheme cytochrome c family protein
MRSPVASFLAIGAAATLLATVVAVAQPAEKKPVGAWRGCCGLEPWAQPGPLKAEPRDTEGPFGGFGYLVGGSSLRHNLGVTGKFPTAFQNLRNPLPPTPQNAQAGAMVYEAECASCHGASGVAEGPAAAKLNPTPAHLGWLARIPPDRRDGFMYWSIAEGGVPLKTDMPAYKGKLTDQQIWSVIGYIQARLPPPKTP